jgi:hypothetical protein
MARGTPFAEPFGRLRLEVDGGWTVQEFASLVLTLDRAYRAACLVESLPSSIGDWSPFFRPYRRYPYDDAPYFFSMRDLADGLVARADVLYGDLDLHAVEYASPGWVEVFGSLNPLEVVRRFVTDWRAENSQRRRDEATAHQAEVDAEILREAQRQTFILEAISRTAALPVAEQGPILDRIRAIWPERELIALSADVRVGAITIGAETEEG